MNFDDLNKLFAKLQFGGKDRMFLYRKFISFLNQGIPLLDVLGEFYALYSRKNGDPRAVILLDIITRMKRGESFSSALSYWAPSSEVMLIESGERSGNIVGALRQAVEVATAIREMRSAIIGGLTYPVILLLVLAAMMVGFSLGIVPKLADVMDPASWPQQAATLYTISQIVENYGLYIAGGIIGLFVVIFYSMPRWTSDVRKFVDGIPPWSVYRSFESSTFLVALGALMKTGTPLMDSITRLRSLASPYVSKHLTIMLAKLKSGQPNGVAMNTGFLEREMAADIEIYGKVSDFQEAMEVIGREAISSGVEKIKMSTKALGNVVLILVAFYTGWVYYAFFTLTSSLGQGAPGM